MGGLSSGNNKYMERAVGKKEEEEEENKDGIGIRRIMCEW